MSPNRGIDPRVSSYTLAELRAKVKKTKNKRKVTSIAPAIFDAELKRQRNIFEMRGNDE